MNFNSWQYLVFFPFVFFLYYAVTAKNKKWSNKASQIMLLAVSLFFYACWNPLYLLLILFSVALTWCSGIIMAGKTRSQKCFVLAGSLVLNLGILFFFKYYNFFADTFVMFTPVHVPSFNALLPVGISFYTFQALGYSIDVYRGTVKAERDFINYALFVTFFPQLVAGPIERTANLLPQFKVNHRFDYDTVTSGLKLAAWGMFKKVVIADRLAVYVNGVYRSPLDFPACSIALATFFFAFQIYCDFSGYSDIAIGSARALGFDLMTNFRRPYFARSITDFWRRWHISLTTWLRDYVYISLGGNRRGLLRQCFNIMIVFALSGLWHGAAWHFVAWGILHGIFQVAERLMSKTFSLNIHFPKNAITKLLQVVVTFVLVCIAWIFFRAESLASAAGICGKLYALPRELAGYIQGIAQTGVVGTVSQMFSLGNGIDAPIQAFGRIAFGLSFIYITCLIAAELLARKETGTTRIMKMPLVMRWTGYVTCILILVLCMQTGSSEFIYFTF